ncbi:MAG TPA: hypothetical protein VFB84_17995 [Micromonosporaceae bacterium]|nr:hypothetical protein [Micromonosporaceae bacterium]
MADQKDIGYLLDMIELDYEMTALRVRARRCVNEIESVRRRLLLLQRVIEERARRQNGSYHQDEAHRQDGAHRPPPDEAH